MNQVDTREIGENQRIVTSWKPGEWNVLEGWRSQQRAQIKIEESLPFGHMELTVDCIQGSLSRMAGCNLDGRGGGGMVCIYEKQDTVR